MSQRLLILTKTTYFDLDKLVSALVLGRLLSAQKQVYVLMPEIVDQQLLTQLIEFKDLEVSTTLAPAAISFELPQQVQIQNIEWEQDNGQLSLTISTKDGHKLTPADLQQKSDNLTQFDQILCVGIKKALEAKELLGSQSNLWDSCQHKIVVDVRSENDKFGTDNYVYPEAKSFAEAVLLMAAQLNLQIDAEIATSLAAAIYWKTNSLRNKYTHQGSFAALTKLTQLGADLDKATSVIFKSKSTLEQKAALEIHQSLKFIESDIVISTIGGDTAKQLEKQPALSPEQNPLYCLKDVRASFVLYPIASGRTRVYCTYDSAALNVKKLFGAYSFVGDEWQAQLSFNMSAQDTEKKIVQILGQSPKQSPSAAHTPVADITEPAEIASQDQSLEVEKTIQEMQPADPLPAADNI